MSDLRLVKGLALMTFQSMMTFCRSLPGASEELKWETHRCFVVHKKIFAIFGTIGTGKAITGVSIKVSKSSFPRITTVEGIEPAPYLAPFHWALITSPAALPRKEMEQLLRTSYSLVVDKLPLKKRMGLLPKRPKSQ